MDVLIALGSVFLLAPLCPVLTRFAGDRAGSLIALLPAALTAFFAQFIGRFESGEALTVVLPWVPGLDVSLSLYLDGLSLFFALLIAAVGTLVCIYSGGYLAGQQRLGGFLGYILFFMGAMLGIVLAGNLLTLYVFWELTSLSSFLLIGFDSDRAAARSAALQALLVTVLGGLALLTGFIMLGLAGDSFELSKLLQQGETVRNHGWYVPILLLVLLGAFSKSAQFPLHFWLPNAMEAPTPVSAYLHSATMVKAGIYLLARMSPVLGGTELWITVVTAVGAVTMFLGAFLAVYEHDMKGILAYLTINVLGTLTMLLGLGTDLAVKAAVAYLMAHALYKGALFLMAGAVDHETHARDIRQLGGLLGTMPLTAAIAILAALSMAGIIPLFGFVAKELFLEAVLEAPRAALWLTGVSVVSTVFLVVGAGLVGVKPFFGRRTPAAEQAHEAGLNLWISPLVLAATGLAVGIFPQRLAAPLVAPAVGATLAKPVEMHLSLWHGVTTPFVLSALALGAGAALYLGRRWTAPLDRLQQTLGRFGPEQWYQWGLLGLNAIARGQTRLLQNGYLGFYVFTIIGTTVALIWLALPGVSAWGRLLDISDVRSYEAVVASLILLGAAVAVRSRSRLTAIAGLGVAGFGVAVMFVLFGAPDPGMTQFVIETLMVILLVLVFYHLPNFKRLSGRGDCLRDALIALAGGGSISMLLLIAHRLRVSTPISEEYIERSFREAHGRNIVNVILVDFRALDTLGEITVLGVAGIGVYALLKLRLAGPRSRGAAPAEPGPSVEPHEHLEQTAAERPDPPRQTKER